MENLSNLELRNVMNELTQGRELANQLQIHLHAPSSSQEVRELLINKIINSYEKVLSVVNYNGHIGDKEQPIAPGGAIVTYESPPRSLSGSPRSQDSEMEFKDHDRNEASKKRKAMPRWTKQVEIDPRMGVEEPLRDGYSWRKYGQKEILGAKHPRSYYRCTYRHSQGCYATRQVQKSDNNPTTLDINYRGTHTCNQTTTFKSLSTTTLEKQESNNIVANNHQHIITQFDQENQILFPDSFNFPSSSTSSSLISHEKFAFLSPTMLDNDFASNFHPISSSSGGSNYFLMSPTQVNDFLGHNIHVQTSDHEITDMASATTSAANSPTIGLDYPFGTMVFGPNYTFDNPGF